MSRLDLIFYSNYHSLTLVNSTFTEFHVIQLVRGEREHLMYAVHLARFQCPGRHTLCSICLDG